MRRKISIGLILIISFVAIYFLFVPTKIADHAVTSSEENISQVRQQEISNELNVSDEKRELEIVAEDLRVEGMKLEYAKLEESRKLLKSRLGKLNARLWNIKLPEEQIAVINKDLSQVVMLLKNPPLLGAFYDIEGIRTEISRFNSAHKKMVDIEEVISTANY